MHTPRQIPSKSQGSSTPSPAARVAWRSVALPVEHGGWGFLLEPTLLGLLVVPSPAGALVALAMAAAFLLRQPVKILLVDLRRGRTFARTQLAWRFVALYAVFVAIGAGAALRLAGSDWLLPPLLALPFGLVFLYYDLTQPGRTWQAELSAPVALASGTASMAIIAGWFPGPAIALWAVLALRAIPSILFVRARLRLERGKDPDRIVPVLAHVIAILFVADMVESGLLPWLSLVAFAVLLIRAAHGLSPRRWLMSVKAIGFTELGLGIFTVLMVAIGYWI
ncbi:MAG: YwiC-like family protein [Caldilineaceae bacterium]|nr:YwiC-like family protein [Caldilineaceae bacterium]